MSAEQEPLTDSRPDVESTYDLVELRQTLARAVTRICPPWLRDCQEDLVEVGLMRVIEVQRKSEGDREFGSSYLYKVAYSALIDEIRRRRRRQEVSMEEENRAERMASSSPNPERRATGQEIGRAIQTCLGTLVRPRRLAVTLHLQGHNIVETAGLLDWPPKRTDNLVYRGLKDLRQCLRSRGFAP